MKIISYNVNGIRAAMRKGLDEWLKAAAPDVLCLQETKAQPDQIETFAFDEAEYHHYWHSAEKKGYSGVALLSRREPDRVVKGTGIDYIDREGRVIRADFGDVSVLSVYFPSGSSGDHRQEVKMRFLEDFRQWAADLRKERPNLSINGDINICHKPIDIHDPVRNAGISGFLPGEREWVSCFLDDGFVDSFRHFNAEPHQYSWWSYRANARANNKGWRIDYNMVSDSLKDKLRGAWILKEAMHSDHCPVAVELEE